MTRASVIVPLALVLTSICFVLGHPGQKAKEDSLGILDNFQPKQGQCSDDNQCYASECCVMSGNRFATPSCQERRQLGEICRPGVNKIKDRTLVYPDGSKIYVKEAHYAVCPCGRGLVCGKKTGVCQNIQDDEREAIEEFINTNKFNYDNNI